MDGLRVNIVGHVAKLMLSITNNVYFLIKNSWYI